MQQKIKMGLRQPITYIFLRGEVYLFLVLNLYCLISYYFDQLLRLFAGLYQLWLQLL